MSWLPPPLRYAYISPAGLANLRHYKYHCVDRSLVAYYVGQPFWNWCVTLLPSWMAPNLVTLVGLCCMLLSYAVVAFHLPRCTGILPPWACVLAAVCTFAYQTLDAIDGKQARRTGSSSPLGELFDHGCDAVTTAVMSMALAATADMGGGVHGLEGVEGAVLLAVLLAGFIVFYLAQWEEYHTDVMTLGYFGVTELHLLVALLYLWTAVMGGAWWRDGPRLLGVLRPTHVLAAASLLGSLSTAATSAVQVAIFYARKQSHSHTRSAEHAALYARRRAALWWHLVPMVVLVGSAILWTTSSPQRILASHPHVFAMVLGFCFSYVVGRMVVARVCKEDVPLSLPVLAPVVLGSLNSFLGGVVNEYKMVWAVLGFELLAYFHFALNIIRQMTEHLHIHCLSLSKPKEAEAAK